MNRRTFIAALTSTPIIARHLASAAAAKAVPGLHLGPIGVQLYSVRSLMEKSIDGTLSSVAAIGYKEVEFAGYFNHTPQQIRGMLVTTHSRRRQPTWASKPTPTSGRKSWTAPPSSVTNGSWCRASTRRT